MAQPSSSTHSEDRPASVQYSEDSTRSSPSTTTRKPAVSRSSPLSSDPDAEGTDEEEEADAEGSPEEEEDPDDEGDDGDEETEAEVPEESSGSEMELDSDDQDQIQSQAPLSIPQTASTSVTSSSEAPKKPLVLKLKLATGASNPDVPSNQQPPTKRKYVRKAPLKNRGPKGSGTKKTDPKMKKKETDEEDELAEEEVGVGVGGLYQAWDESDDDGSVANPNSLTVRQRAKEFGSQVTDLQSLPMKETKKIPKELTEADKAMEKAEKSRKRKHQTEKKLEDEKTETINRLLKGQVGKARGTRQVEAVEESSTGAVPTATASVSKLISADSRVPRLIRYVSSIKSGKYVAELSFPSTTTTAIGL